jgi:tRNA G46 methylase TrmB
MKKLQIPKRIRNHVNPLAYEQDMFFVGFKTKDPIIVDIGAYRGEFGAKLVDKFADEKQKRNFIFFEIRKPFVDYLEQLFLEKENVKIFGGNAGMNLQSILQPSISNGVTIEKIFINFPDP